MKKANFSDKDIHSILSKSKLHVDTRLCSKTFKRLNYAISKRTFCPPTLFSPNNNTDGILIKLLMSTYEVSGQKSQVCVPSRKVGNPIDNILFTKKSHRYNMKNSEIKLL